MKEENLEVSTAEELVGEGETTNIADEKLYTVEEMADILRIKVGALKDWTKLKENPCPCLRYGSKYLRFEKSAVRAWLRSRTVEWYATMHD